MNIYLQNIIDKSLEQGERTLQLRNIYKYTYGQANLNEILDVIEKEKFIIIANNAYTIETAKQMTGTSMVIVELLKGRKKEKNLAKDLEKQGLIEEAAKHDIIQTKLKQDINSIYGSASQRGNFLYNPDTASGITTQSRNVVAEMMWSFEKLLAGNTMITSYNEAFLYFNNILKETRHYSEFKDWLTYIPNKYEFRQRILRNLIDIDDYYDKTKNISKSLFYFLDTRTEEEMIYLYYKNNLHDLLFKNPKIINIFKDILNINEVFYDPYNIPEIYKKQIDLLYSILNEFVIHHKSTCNRVEKFQTRKRDVILLSDTDSLFLCFQNILKNIYDYFKYNKNDDSDFKLVNVLCSICVTYIKKQHELFMKDSNAVSPIPSNILSMKNEFYYKRMILYSGLQKNYTGRVLLREGNLVPEKKQIASTGIKLTSSKIPKIIIEFQKNLISEYILKPKEINPIAILSEINKIREVITAQLNDGNKSLGIKIRYSGKDNYKNANSNEAYLLAEQFSRLYPESKLLGGEYMMKFPTKVRDIDELWRLKDDNMAALIRERIYCDTWDGQRNVLKIKGIKSVAIPLDGDIFTIPSWILNILDHESLIDYHLSQIYDLLPSIGISLIQRNNKSTYSNLVKF